MSQTPRRWRFTSRLKRRRKREGPQILRAFAVAMIVFVTGNDAIAARRNNSAAAARKNADAHRAARDTRSAGDNTDVNNTAAAPAPGRSRYRCPEHTDSPPPAHKPYPANRSRK